MAVIKFTSTIKSISRTEGYIKGAAKFVAKVQSVSKLPGSGISFPNHTLDSRAIIVSGANRIILAKEN